MLTTLILLPIIGAILIAIIPPPSDQEPDSFQIPRYISLTISFIVFLISLLIATRFDPTIPKEQFTESIPWIDQIGLTYHLAIDGLSLPLLILNSLLTWIAIYSTTKIITRPKLYFILILLLSAGVTGAFLAGDLLLFFLFYELELIPLYFLIAIWGGEKRAYAATKFLIYTALSGIIIISSFFGLAVLSGSNSFDLTILQKTIPTLSLGTQTILLIGILIGFGIKIPLVPFHTWLPDAHVEASTQISVLLAGVLLKLGTYGFFRFGFGLLQPAWISIAPWLATWAVISVLYGSLTAIAQKDMKKMVAFSSIGHMGYILLAMAAGTSISLMGAMFQMISHGLISAMLFLLVGVVYKKTGSRDLRILRGLLTPQRGLPLTGSLMILGVMASAGIPGMVGFISEFLVFRGSFSIFPIQTLLCMVGTGLTAVYFLLLVNLAFFGRLSEPVMDLPREKWNDRSPAALLAILIVIFGLFPNLLSYWSESTTNALAIPQTTISRYFQ